MFGNLGTTPSTNTNTGFGAFSNANSGTTTGAFGAKPASGFGAFGGGTGAFGGGGTTSVFGQPATNPAPATTSVFGQPAATTGTTNSAFGGTNSLFGGNKFGTTPSASNPVVTTGTANPPFASIHEKDGNLNLQFQSISCMPQYIGYSFEELRVQDYAQGRKTASTTGAFGQPAFGQSQPASTGLFGAQPTQQPTTSLFGATTNTNTTNAGFGAFGQNTAQQPVSNSQGLFGNTNLFGQAQPQQQPQPQNAFSSTGAFGQPAQQTQQQSSIFGGGGGAFGAAKPAFSAFGGGGGTGAFGTANTQSAFGGQQQQPQQTTTGLFGNTQPAANTTSAFGGFGSTANKPSIFGTPTTTQPATSTFGGAFGNTNQQQQQPNQQQTQQPSLFGNSTTTNLFGQQQPQNQQQQAQPSLFGNTQATTTPSLFSSTNTGTNLFGNTQQNQQQQQQQQQPQQPGTNLFGNIFNKPAQPAAPSLFGGLGQSQANTSQTQAPSLFGNTFGSTTQPNSLFGSKPAAPPMGSSFSNSQGMGMSTSNIFGGSVNTPAVQGTLTASIAQPIGENLPIFSMLPPGPRVLDNDQNAQKKKAGYFLDMPTRSPIPRVQLGFTPANSKLRGFGSVSSLTSSTANANTPVSFTSGKQGALSLNRSEAMSSSIGPDFLGRSGSPALGSGNRHSVKKVILEKKVEPTELFVKSGSPGALRAGKVTFSPALSIASREKEAALAASALQMHDSPTPASRTQSANRSNHKDLAPAEKEAEKEPQSTGLDDGDYWVQPDLPTLKKKGYDELSAFSGLVVGRKGYGEIHFLEPVDLTGLPKLGALLGEVVKFDDKECSVYPDSEDVDKPPPGSGLNVKAKIILGRCWALDKATREPIMDATHPTAVKHLKRLKNMKDTHFEGFDMKTGTWTFTVDHF